MCHFDEPLQSGSRVNSHAPSDENSGCESSSGEIVGKMEKRPAGQLTKVKSKQEVVLEAHRDKMKSPLCCNDGNIITSKTLS